jgi:hypothetical protein
VTWLDGSVHSLSETVKVTMKPGSSTSSLGTSYSNIWLLLQTNTLHLHSVQSGAGQDGILLGSDVVLLVVQVDFGQRVNTLAKEEGNKHSRDDGGQRQIHVQMTKFISGANKGSGVHARVCDVGVAVRKKGTFARRNLFTVAYLLFIYNKEPMRSKKNTPSSSTLVWTLFIHLRIC